ncbi:MAG: HEAT repeat domain-containing protein, partial [Actinomycetota bacterium]
LIVATRVSDLTLGDGTARAAVGAAYQAVSGPERLAAQANVEGLGVPIAIGFSGVVLLVMRATVGTDGVALPVITSVVVALWLIVAVLVYRGYGVNLLANLRQRVLDPVEVEVNSTGSYAVVQRLLGSTDLRDVRLALDALTAAKHPDLAAHLDRLAGSGDVRGRREALERLVRVEPARAASIARRGLGDPDARIRAMSVGALGLAGTSDDAPAIAEVALDDDDDVKLAAAVAMSQVGDISRHVELQARIASLAHSALSRERILAGRILGGCAGDASIDRRVLKALVGDADPDVANAALDAVHCPADVDVLAHAIHRLAHRETAAAAVDALERSADLSLPFVIEALETPGAYGRHVTERLIRVARTVGGPRATAILRDHVSHLDRDLGLLVMTALAAVSASASPDTPDASAGASDRAINNALLLDVQHAANVVHALVLLDGFAPADPLRSALRDEIGLLRRRVLATLSLRHGAGSIDHIAAQLSAHGTRGHARALEWLDVTLSGTDRSGLAVLEPGVGSGARLGTLARYVTSDSKSAADVVRDIAEDRRDAWRRPWLSACALVVASRLPDFAFDSLNLDLVLAGRPAAATDPDEIVPETLHAIRRSRPPIPSQGTRIEAKDTR